MLRIVLEKLGEQLRRHHPLGSFGAFVLTIFICYFIHLVAQNIYRLLYLARYIDNDRISDLIYQYRYDSEERPYAIPIESTISSESEGIEYENYSDESLDKRIYRYGPELSQPIINTINICSNNSIDLPDTRVIVSEDYISVVCGIVVIFSPVFNLGSFGRATVGILILPEEYYWLFASTEEVEDFPGYGLAPVGVELQRQSVLEWIDKSNGIIAAGAASYEGELEEEEERADVRSEEVYALLLNVLSEYRIAKSLFKLNLGKYNEDLCAFSLDENSNYQRPIVIIGVFTDGNDNDFISLNQAQKGVNQINKNPPLENIDFNCYSNFPDLKVDTDLKSKDSLIDNAF